VKQGKKLRDASEAALSAWLTGSVIPLIEGELRRNGLSASVSAIERKAVLEYAPAVAGHSYVAPKVVVEFWGRSTGEPCSTMLVECDATPHLPTLEFPTAEPRVLSAECTFWEKAMAAHAFCLRGKLPAERYVRHWHDLVRLRRAGIASQAIAASTLARAVAAEKAVLYRVPGVNYEDTITGRLRLIPSDASLRALEADYVQMVAGGLLQEDDAPPFLELMDACRQLEGEINQAMRPG
jgi:hypothetical protein